MEQCGTSKKGKGGNAEWEKSGGHMYVCCVNAWFWPIFIERMEIE